MPGSEYVAQSLILVSIFLGIAAALLVPLLPAWYFSRSGDQTFPSRRWFLAVCLFLSHGVLSVAGIPFIPLELTAIWLVPQLNSDGYDTLAHAVTFGVQAGDVFPYCIALVACLLVPKWLYSRWPRIVQALN